MSHNFCKQRDGLSRAVIQVTVNIGKNSQATIEAQIARRGELKIFLGHLK